MATLQELRDLSPQELRNRAAELKQTLFDLRNKANTGVLDSTADLMKTKRDIARCLTVAREKELAEAAGAGKKE
jgi:large subunit ribosomal protein L29